MGNHNSKSRHTRRKVPTISTIKKPKSFATAAEGSNDKTHAVPSLTMGCGSSTAATAESPSSSNIVNMNEKTKINNGNSKSGGVLINGHVGTTTTNTSTAVATRIPAIKRDSDTSNEDDENNEPKIPLAVGARRFSSLEINTPLKPTNTSTTLPRRESTTTTLKRSTVPIMPNIYSTPLLATLSYTPPSFPKSHVDAEFLSIALQRNFVFANALSDDDASHKRELIQIVAAFEPHTVSSRGTVILKGQVVGDYFYILHEGIVEYTNIDPKTHKRQVVRTANRPGQSFGELCLLYDCPPPAECVAGCDGVKLWRLNKETFRLIMALTSMKKDERMRAAIRKVRGLEELDGEFVGRIADALDVRVAEAGTVLYKVGERADGFYVLGLQGSIQVTPGTDQKSQVMGPGEAVGEEAIVLANGDDPPVRTETATALEQSTLFYMSREQLHRVIGSLEDAIQLSRDRRLLKSVPLFRDSDFEEFEYELLAALIERTHFKQGKEICLEEEVVEEPALFIVYDGILDVACEADAKREKTLQKGDFFGEATLLPDKNSKFGGAKGGNKYHEETVEVVSDTAVCGKLTLANIDSVILDLHRLGCLRRVGHKLSPKTTLRASSSEQEPRPESLSDLKYHHLFGAGTFGRVWCVTRVGGNTAYALKIQSKRELLDQRQASSAARERGVMAKLDHPFVCKLVNTFQDESCIYMLLTLIQGGELLNLIQGGEAYGGLPESAAKFYAAVIAEGLTYMHRRHIVYRDLKPENVLIDKDGYAVIVDFGFGKIVTDKTYTFCGTPLYLAPEIVLSRGHDRAVDYWSLGCLIYEMLFATTPFYEKGIDQKGLFKNIVRGKWTIPQKSKLSKPAIDLIDGMLQRKPTERLGCLAGGYRDIKNHPWMREVNFVKLVKKQIKSPWIPTIDDPLDISNFENFQSDGEDFTKGKKPLTAEEQLVFQDF